MSDCPYGDKCPILTGPSSDCSYCAAQRCGAELRRMMEDLWNSPRVVNARRPARYVKPMRLGSEWGYQDEIFGE